VRKMKGVYYRYLVIVFENWNTENWNGKEKWFFSKDKAERYCVHLERNSKRYHFHDMEVWAY